MKLLQYNLIALTAVFISRYLNIPLDHYNSDIGNLLWLPMGAVLLSYLLFGFKVFPGVLIGYLLAELVIEGGGADITNQEVMSRVINSLMPIVAIVVMRKFNFSNFFTSGKINYTRMVPLVIFAALITTLVKFILLYVPTEFSAGKVYALSYIQGDIVGGIVFIVVTVGLFSATLVKRKLI